MPIPFPAELVVTAHPVPGGVAAPDGRTIYAALATGVAAVDAATGAVRWETVAIDVPVLATDAALIGLDVRHQDTDRWYGPAALVILSLADPSGAPTRVPLPDGDGRLIGPWIEAGALHADWELAPVGDAEPARRRLALDLRRGTLTVADGPAPRVPAAIAAELAAVERWPPADLGPNPWRTSRGVAALVLVRSPDGPVATLRHWPGGGESLTAPLLGPAELPFAAYADHVADHLVLRACDATGAACAWRVVDATTGRIRWELRDAPTPPLVPPFGVVGDLLLGMDPTPGAPRTVVALEGATGTRRWSLPLRPLAAPAPRP
jgi:hypothetical protein